MLQSFEEACAQHSYPNVHLERFSADMPRPAAPGTSEFNVELVRSGRTVHVTAGETVLAAVQAAGVTVDYACEQGVCGACETKVISGAVVHCDSVLSSEEQRTNKTMMICVSRCASERLVLDL